MDWRPRLILLTGTETAATVGFTLAALIVRISLEKRPRSSDLSAQETREFFERGIDGRPLTVRGYDTPEPWREDAPESGTSIPTQTNIQ